MHHASGLKITASVTDKPFAVTIDESSRGADNTLEAAGTVPSVSRLPVCSTSAVSPSPASSRCRPLHQPNAGADGHVDDDSSASATFVGVYMGEDGIDIALGDLVPVLCAGIVE